MLRILVVVAHPDDIEFGCAGTIAQWVREGAEVIYCIVTDGSAGSNDPAISPKILAARRYNEQLAAARIVGVEQVYFLGYRDGILQPTPELRRDLIRIIRTIRPGRVVCQDPTTIFVEDSGINHPDHRAAGKAALGVVFCEPCQVSEVYFTRTVKPNTHIDISATIEQKLEALRCHQSQVDEQAIEALRIWTAENGKKLGCAYAESFRVMNLSREGHGFYSNVHRDIVPEGY